MTDNSPIVDAIKIAGSEAKLARLAGYSQVAINKAKKTGRCSAEMAVAIERATQMQVLRSRLRPDLWSEAA